MRVFVPAFDGDLVPIVGQLMRRSSPGYLRLGLSENVNGLEIPSYAPWRRLLARGARGATIVVVGPLVGGIANAARAVESDVRPGVWLLSELPIDEFPPEFIDDVVASRRLIVVEEHVEHGGAGEMVAAKLLTQGIAPTQFSRLTARGYPSGLYGSQAFHRNECGLDAASVLTAALRD
jgi:transketolase